jgi:Uma2 family endonuclease
LTRAEFLRRWEAEPAIKKAELLGGMVYMPSPVSVKHGVRDSDVNCWLKIYSVHTPGTESGHDVTTFLLEETPQPDVNLRVLRDHGGGSWEEGKYLHGIPELLAEVSASSASYDLHVKLEVYEAAKVPEYVVVLLYEREIRWHVLVDGKYQVLPADADGIWRSRIFPGLWLDGAALFAGNMQQVLRKLEEGCHSPEHRAFVEELLRRKS